MLNSSTNGFMEPLLTDCRNMYVVPNKQIRHVLQEANRCVDTLANLGTTLLFNYIPFV